MKFKSARVGNPKIDLNWKSSKQGDRTISVAKKDGFELLVTHYRKRVMYYWEIRKAGREVLESGGVKGSLYGAKALAKCALLKRLKN